MIIKSPICFEMLFTFYAFIFFGTTILNYFITFLNYFSTSLLVAIKLEFGGKLLLAIVALQWLFFVSWDIVVTEPRILLKNLVTFLQLEKNQILNDEKGTFILNKIKFKIILIPSKAFIFIERMTLHNAAAITLLPSNRFLLFESHSEFMSFLKLWCFCGCGVIKGGNGFSLESLVLWNRFRLLNSNEFKWATFQARHVSLLTLVFLIATNTQITLDTTVWRWVK